MTAADRSVVEKKLLQITERIERLRLYLSEGWDRYTDDFERKKTTEKLLQEMIEAAIDVNTHVSVEEAGKVPADYFDSFVSLGKIGWISKALAEKLAPSSGLRNRLVHLYAEIDDRKIFSYLAFAIDLFGEYVRSIRKNLKS